MSWHKRLILEWMSAWQQQSHTALSATPNDGIHLLFYGHSWSSAAPIWPKCTISLSLLLSPCAIYLSSFFLFYPLLSSGSRIFIFRCSQFTLDSLSFPPPSSTSVFYTFPSFLCASLPWCSFYGQQPWAPHLSLSGLMCFRKGWIDVGGEGPRGAQRAKYQTNMSPSCLMTSTIQPCRALTVHLHPEGNCDMMAICLFHTAQMSHFIIRRLTHHEATFFCRKGCRFL